MGWEYRAVEWTSHDPDYDKVFLGHRTKLIAEGWEEHLRASWRPSLTGGACIMRRPKDEPPRFHRDRHGELVREDEPPKDEEPGLAERHWLYREHYGAEPPRYYFLPKPDEPRMWTEGEIEAIGEKVLAHDKRLFESILEDAQTEADRQTAYNRDLRKQNEQLQAGVDGQYRTIVELPRRVARLQAAIDEVVARARDQSLGIGDTHMAVAKHLYPLVTKKEETNG